MYEIVKAVFADDNGISDDADESKSRLVLSLFG